MKLKSSELYTVAWITALPIERAAALALLHEKHSKPCGFVQQKADSNSYSWGRIGEHNIVITSLKAGGKGTISAATTVSELLCSLPHIRIGLLVGIGGGIPKSEHGHPDIRLGDVVVSNPHGTTGGVVQYDFGKAKAEGVWERTGSLNEPPAVLLNALDNLKATHLATPPKTFDLLQQMWDANDGYIREVDNDYTYQGDQQQSDKVFS
ncbi:hypothetical protein H9Q72_003730 [Fusarium xylarioides]|uniref:Nucleoside phosphorylase domain-containing protein n=1 Tax=Fusarium xylarioides TaxID=221167 RepID=A0A9P7IVT7_9HYPO|nr:hypothetical protein H9Q70_013298 [Fusarium xylarioides]KAG5768904.1 hypothetical protein H9Q72_003730 [Fusarium xylarioides]KAG5770539.1 hypothetical protein H9Q73_013137 [Fusarium xylarioides]KAG5815499.1 hypothetical protein H9Q74_011647 [Fusarium xylarioides]KAG5820031.1 hypothetical protein H9Q71_000731 [Fusarium xylarioides]